MKHKVTKRSTKARRVAQFARKLGDLEAVSKRCASLPVRHCRSPIALSRKIAPRRHFSVRFFGRFAIGIWEERVCREPDWESGCRAPSCARRGTKTAHQSPLICTY